MTAAAVVVLDGSEGHLDAVGGARLWALLSLGSVSLSLVLLVCALDSARRRWWCLLSYDFRLRLVARSCSRPGLCRISSAVDPVLFAVVRFSLRCAFGASLGCSRGVSAGGVLCCPGACCRSPFLPVLARAFRVPYWRGCVRVEVSADAIGSSAFSPAAVSCGPVARRHRVGSSALRHELLYAFLWA